MCGCGAALPDEHKLMLRPVKRSHAGVVLVPDTEVLELAVDGMAGVEHFGHVSPVHTDLMDGPVGGVRRQLLEDRGQEAREFGLAHLAAAHGKAAVPDTTESAHMTVDWDVIGRIGEDELRFGITQQPGIGRRVSGVVA